MLKAGMAYRRHSMMASSQTKKQDNGEAEGFVGKGPKAQGIVGFGVVWKVKDEVVRDQQQGNISEAEG